MCKRLCVKGCLLCVMCVIFVSSHLHILFLQLYIVKSAARLHLFASKHVHLFTSSHLHTLTTSHTHHIITFTTSLHFFAPYTFTFSFLIIIIHVFLFMYLISVSCYTIFTLTYPTISLFALGPSVV